MQLKTFLEKENVRASQLDSELRIHKSNEQKMVSEYE
jgi:hypothetical protein